MYCLFDYGQETPNQTFQITAINRRI